MNDTIQFIVIDDDACNNQIVQITLKKYAAADDVKTFISAVDALKFISQTTQNKDCTYTSIILLDINMPGMSGWEFLDIYDSFDETIKECFVIYMLSSSIDINDIDRSKKNKYVKGYLVKPLFKDKILISQPLKSQICDI